MKRKIIKEIDGESVSSYSFGVKKEILETVAKGPELKKFKALVDKRLKLRKEAWARNERWPSYRDIAPIDSELRGYRHYWRIQYTNSFDNGLYKSTKTLRYQVGKCQGEFGTTWRNSRIEKNTLFMYIRHDPVGNIELMNLANNELVKVKRGAASSEAFIKVNEGEDNE